MTAKVVVCKVRGGKLFRLRHDPSAPSGQVSLDGDFFLYPEEGLEILQLHLEECLRMEDEATAVLFLKNKLEENSIQMIGVDAADLIAALWEARG